jgi:hypothetical protein
MSANVVNFAEKRSVLLKKGVEYSRQQNQLKTLKFANYLNVTVENTEIDPVHKATLLIAKAIDVLSLAGPVPCGVDDQHARATNLLQSIFRARRDIIEKSVRIITPNNVKFQMRENDGLSI